MNCRIIFTKFEKKIEPGRHIGNFGGIIKFSFSENKPITEVNFLLRTTDWLVCKPFKRIHF